MNCLYADAALSVKSSMFMKFEDVRLDIRFCERPDSHAAKLRDQMVLRDQRERGMGGWRDHRLLALDPFAHKGLEVCIRRHFLFFPFVAVVSAARLMRATQIL